jgi:hypothetical protein
VKVNRTGKNTYRKNHAEKGCIRSLSLLKSSQQNSKQIRTRWDINVLRTPKQNVFYHTFLKPTKGALLIYYTIFFPVKSVQHVSVPYFGTIIRDPCCELHKITNQQIMVHIKTSRGKM